jgi:hypothetical protein
MLEKHALRDGVKVGVMRCIYEAYDVPRFRSGEDRAEMLSMGWKRPGRGDGGHCSVVPDKRRKAETNDLAPQNVTAGIALRRKQRILLLFFMALRYLHFKLFLKLQSCRSD